MMRFACAAAVLSLASCSVMQSLMPQGEPKTGAITKVISITLHF